ncbi:MAG TPA: hypothetical protein VKE69_05870 [Planctomycetota bacterium]|nr:hypothetical protein [Planctomycetota bacterium]
MNPFFLLLLLLSQDPASRPAGNPFRGDEELLRKLGLLTTEGGYAPLRDATTLPTMRLRGLIKLKDRKAAAALIDVEGIGALVVREGDQISLWDSAGASRGSYGAVSRSDSGAGAHAATGRGPAAHPAGRAPETLPPALKIERIGPDGVVVEIGTLGRSLVIR